MNFNFQNLDKKTRKMMEEEVSLDLQNNRLYFGKNLSDLGRKEYVSLLKQAIMDGDEQILTQALSKPGIFNQTTIRNTVKGTITVKVPITANTTLAEGEFNRFYIRGICRRAIDEGVALEVYRAKQVTQPRLESEQMIGKLVEPKKLLDDLRVNIGVNTALGLPQGPNSGLSVKLKA